MILDNKPRRFAYHEDILPWWFFFALNTSGAKIKHNGEDKDVELGAVIWVKFFDMKQGMESSSQAGDKEAHETKLTIGF